MNIEFAQRVAKAFMKANVPLHIWGPAGLGKSTFIEELAEKEGYHVIDLRLATQEVGDLIGVPYKQEVEVQIITGRDAKGEPIVQTGKRIITQWAEPHWMSEVFEKEAQGIHCLVNADEMDRAPKEVINAFYQFVSKRQFHEHRLPKETRLIACGNPPTEEYLVDTFDRAMETRWGHIQIECDPDVWLKQFGPRCHPDVSGFIAVQPDALCMKPKKVWDVGTVQTNTPRGIEFVNKIYEAIGSEDKVLLQVCVGSIVGRAVAMQFMESLEKAWVNVEDVLAGKTTIESITGSEDGNLKLIRLTHEIMSSMTMKSFDKGTNGDKNKVEERKENFANFITGLAKYKQDLIVAIASVLGYRDPALFRLMIIKNPAIGEITKSLSVKLRSEMF